MKKRILGSAMATIMALTLAFGGTMTAFAEEKVQETVKTVPGDAKPIDVTISYQKGDDITNPKPEDPEDESNKDDTELNIYNIQIAYDNLDFSYEAEAIKWNTTTLVYDITTKDKGGTTRDITVTNRSNTAVTMTPSLVDPVTKITGVEYEVSLMRGTDTLWTASNADTPQKVDEGSKKLAWGKDADDAGTNKDKLTVSVPAIKLTSESIERTINKETAAKVSLAFANAGKSK